MCFGGGRRGMSAYVAGTSERLGHLLSGRATGVHGIGKRIVLTGIDQGVSSLSNFAVGVAVARIVGIAALGAYALAYVVWLAAADVHRSLITDPMAIDNDIKSSDVKRHLQTGLASELTLGAAVAVAVGCAGLILLAVGQGVYGETFLALAPWIPFLLVQDYWRWVAFMKAAPGQALTNDAMFCVVQGGAFALLLRVGVHSSVLAIGAWGLGALAGSAFGVLQHGVAPGFRGGIGGIRRRWGMTKFLLGASATHWGASQGYVLFTGILLGPVGIGGLKAAQSLVSGPSLVLFQLGGNIGLPEAARAVHYRGWEGLHKVSRALTVAAVVGIGLVGIVVIVFGRGLLTDLYGHQFARFASTADVLALSIFLSTLGFGAVLGLKATKLTEIIFRNSILMLIVSVIAVAVMVPLFGVVGAAGAASVRTGATAITTRYLHRRHSRKAADRMRDDERSSQASRRKTRPSSRRGGRRPGPKSGTATVRPGGTKSATPSTDGDPVVARAGRDDVRDDGPNDSILVW